MGLAHVHANILSTQITSYAVIMTAMIPFLQSNLLPVWEQTGEKKWLFSSMDTSICGNRQMSSPNLQHSFTAHIRCASDRGSGTPPHQCAHGS